MYSNVHDLSDVIPMYERISCHPECVTVPQSIYRYQTPRDNIIEQNKKLTQLLSRCMWAKQTIDPQEVYVHTKTDNRPTRSLRKHKNRQQTHKKFM